MPRESLAPHRNDIISRYSQGESAASIARHYKVTTTTLTRALKGAGVMPHIPRGGDRRGDRDRILSAFRDGVRPSQIMKGFNVSRSGLFSMLKRAGLKLRGLDSWTPTKDMLVSAAITRELGGKLNANEKRISDLLSAAGLECRPQVAIKTGNLDLLIPSHSVAVEVCLRGTLTRYIDNGWLEKRIRDCADRGWHTYVYAAANAPDITVDSIQDIAAWVDFLHRSPASRRQYRMVWCGVELLACGCSDDDQITLVKPSRHAERIANRKSGN